jgi:hypothetical protein
MKLNSIINKLPETDTVTIVNDFDEIIIDCEAVANLKESKTYRENLKMQNILGLSVGKVHGDLVIRI